jgi:hypothetical protein
VDPLDVLLELAITTLTGAGLTVELLVVGRWGDRHTQLFQLRADRLDTPAQTIRAVAMALMIGYEGGDYCAGRSSAAAKKADAVFKIEFVI